jgi:hypothetical protein
MGLRTGQLALTIVGRISIDEFEPKTGESKDVIVVGFFVSQRAAAEDLYHFFTNSIVDTRDVENSTNPNQDGYYMVFVEFTRSDQFMDSLTNLLSEIKIVANISSWKAKTHLVDEYIDITDSAFKSYLITDPKKYMSREEWDQQQQAMQEQEKQTLMDKHNIIQSLLSGTNFLDAQLDEDSLTITDNNSVIEMNVVAVGEADTVMNDLSLSESSINQQADFSLGKKLRGMMAETQVLPIGNYWVFFNPNNTKVMVAQAK